MSEKFSLKDHLFNTESVTKFCNYFYTQDKKFPKKKFLKNCEENFPQLELKERIEYMTDLLEEYLPKDNFKKTVKILLAALPEKLDPKKTDDDFGEFIIAPFSRYISRHGLHEEYLKTSFKTLREITMRFSVEFDIRYFINAFPKETLEFLEECSFDKNYHVRRLASEGLRPSLPWAQKINIDYKKAGKILNSLFSDTTRYVTRSVANHMNDISKINAELVLDTLKDWKFTQQQNEDEMNFIIKHSLRTLLKQGNKKALAMLGYKKPAAIEISHLKISKEVALGNNLEFSFILDSFLDQKLMISYKVFFLTKNNSYGEKVFQVKKTEMEKDESKTFSKKHLFREMTTKKLYSGKHAIQVIVNGLAVGDKKFFTLTK